MESHSIPRIKEFKGMMNAGDAATGLQYMSNSTYYSVVITMKGTQMELQRILTSFATFDLSNNMFEEEIPNVLGKIVSLKGLNLSHNRIIGYIPQSFRNVVNLEWLDLSSNKIKGEIPMALTLLKFLALLNLLQNQLEGIIPQGKQFNTFPNDSYSGNPRLCGFPLSKKWSKDEEEQPPYSSTFHNEEELGFGWKLVALGYERGMVSGVFMGYVVFSTKPRWLLRILVDYYGVLLVTSFS